jgi:hypothetical protein
VLLVIGLGWQPSAAFIDAAIEQSDPASLFRAQTIRILPVDSTHLRLRLEGREYWIVDSAGFSVPRSPSSDFVPVVAGPGRNTITTYGVSAAHQRFELSMARRGSLGFHLSSGPKTQQDYPASDQTVRIEPVSAIHVRLHVVGRENWIVDSAGFSLVPDVDFLRIVASPGRNAVTAIGVLRIVETFELSITPSGWLQVQSANSQRKKTTYGTR